MTRTPLARISASGGLGSAARASSSAATAESNVSRPLFRPPATSEPTAPGWSAVSRIARALPNERSNAANPTGPMPLTDATTTHASRSLRPADAVGGSASPTPAAPADPTPSTSARLPDRRTRGRRAEPGCLVQVRPRDDGIPGKIGDRSGDPKQPLGAAAAETLELGELDRASG